MQRNGECTLEIFLLVSISILMLCWFSFLHSPTIILYYTKLYYIIVCSSCRNADQINKNKIIAMMNTSNQDNEDRIVTLTTFEEVGVPVHDEFGQTERKYNIDETFVLRLGGSFFFLKSGLSSLTNLMKIEFKRLVSFPADELSRLPNLIDLQCEDCWNFAAPNSNHQLMSLKRFTMVGRGSHDSNFNEWIVRSLPVLEELHFGDFARPSGPNPYPDEDRPSICTTLQSNDCVFNQSLRILKVSDWRMFQNHNVAEMIVGDILPIFPNLRHIDTRHCFCRFEFGSSGEPSTLGTVVASSSDHEATVNDDQNIIVTLLTFKEADEDVDGCGRYNKIDREYNIDETTALDICMERDRVWVLSDNIQSLINLTKINLHHIVSFPLEQLAILPNLTDLDLSNCKHFDIPDSMQFKSLRSFAMRGMLLRNDPNNYFNFDKWIVRSLPVLEELYYSDNYYSDNIFGESDSQNCIYTALQRDDCVFNQSLRILEISTEFDNVDIIETILIDIIPKFPNVRHLDTRGGSFCRLNSNTIFNEDGFMGANSLKKVAQRLKLINTSNIQLRTIQGLLEGLLRLKMTTYPKEKQILLHDMRDTIGNLAVDELIEDPEETQAMLSILSSFRYLYNIGNYRLNEEVESRLRINHGGGALVDGSSQCDEPIPLIYWPMILERVCEQSKSTFAKNISHICGTQIHKDSEFIMDERNATGIHNLVRSGPLFQHILQLGKMKVPTPSHQIISRKRKDLN